MAKIADEAIGAYAVRDLYQRLYVPLSNFTVHAGSGSLLRHVRSGGAVHRRPARSWNRRSPARVADACMGYLAAVVAKDAGEPDQRFLGYADRHNNRTLLPMAFMIAGQKNFMTAHATRKKTTPCMTSVIARFIAYS